MADFRGESIWRLSLKVFAVFGGNNYTYKSKLNQVMTNIWKYIAEKFWKWSLIQFDRKFAGSKPDKVKSMVLFSWTPQPQNFERNPTGTNAVWNAIPFYGQKISSRVFGGSII